MKTVSPQRPPTTKLPSKGSQVARVRNIDGEIVGSHEVRDNDAGVAGKVPRRTVMPPPKATEAVETHQLWAPRERPRCSKGQALKHEAPWMRTQKATKPAVELGPNEDTLEGSHGAHETLELPSRVA